MKKTKTIDCRGYECPECTVFTSSLENSLLTGSTKYKGNLFEDYDLVDDSDEWE